MIDWDVAERTGARLAPRGPELAPDEASRVVGELRRVAEEAIAPVAETTGLACAPDTADTVVTDRLTWLRSNVTGFRDLLEPVLDVGIGPVGAKASAVQLGALLAWMSSRVLGQFEAFAPRPRLLLVAPTIYEVERKLDVVPRDFRLWVALHEETHRVQFGAVPWLGQHLMGEVRALIELTQAQAPGIAGRLGDGVRAVMAGGSILDALQTPEQRRHIDRITALMSLLEGHADYVMDSTAPHLVPSLATIRSRFDRRRASPGMVEGLVRRLLGLDAKLRQYTDGAAFVRAVVADVGIGGFNAVWDSPATLPSLEEIHAPERWVARLAHEDAVPRERLAHEETGR